MLNPNRFKSFARAGVRALAAVLLACAGASNAQNVKVETRNSNGDSAIVATNASMAPILLKVELTEQRNISSEALWPLSVVIPPRREIVVATLGVTQKSRPWSFRYRTTWSIGNPSAQHDPHALYRLPFPDGYSFRITQASGGAVTTHHDADSEFAVDIAMPIGTPVLAARSGYVIDVVQNYGEGRPEPRFLSKANVVRIIHEDGTWAEYAHLASHSAHVFPGQYVDAGTQIGLSGNSGYSSGPHLHFVVKRNAGGEDASVRFQFFNRAHGTFAAKQGELVAADYNWPADPVSPGASTAIGASPVNERPARSMRGN